MNTNSKNKRLPSETNVWHEVHYEGEIIIKLELSGH